MLAIEKGTLGFMCMYNPQNMVGEINNIFTLIEEGKGIKVENKMRLYGRILKRKKYQKPNEKKRTLVYACAK